MVGEVKEEEEPEGEVVAGPSGEAIVHSSDNMPLLPFSHYFFLKTSHQPFLTAFYCSIPFHFEMDFHPELCLSLLFLVHPMCRWIWRWGRSESGDQRGTGTGDPTQLDGGGRFTSARWRGGAKIVVRGIFPLLAWCLYGFPVVFSFFVSILHLTSLSLCLISRG